MEQKTTFFIKTFGCQMNTADSERMAAILSDNEYHEAEQADKADIILINGCSVREKAVHKALSALGIYKKMKSSSGQKPILGVGGCVGQLDKEQLFQKAPYLDFVFGTDTIDQLPEMLYRVKNGERHLLCTDFDPSMSYSTSTKIHRPSAQAFVNIMKGCDKFCTYCIVPFTRGREKSRTIDEVLEDIRALIKKGVKEITLLGQNVNSFGKGNPNIHQRTPLELHNIIGKVGPRAGEENFPQLLYAIEQDSECQELARIRFTSSHPLDFSDELIYSYTQLKKLSRQLHLPVQSGSNRILSKMGRHHKIEHYIDQMLSLKKLCPDVALSTDLIVGFPTETEEDFQATLTLLDTIQYDNIYAFAYSERPNTRASKMPDDIPLEVKKDRLNRVLDYQNTISKKIYTQHIGLTTDVLVEGPAKNQNIAKNDQSLGHMVWTGRTSCNKIVNFTTPQVRNLTGKLLPLKIVAASTLSLQGEMIL